MHQQRDASNVLDVRLRHAGRRVVQDPPLALTLFGGTRFALLWLIARVLLGWELLSAGRDKLRDSAWMDGGLALRAVWQDAANREAGWSGDVLQYLLRHEWNGWLAPTIAVAETLVGIALILGLFTGIAAFTGGLLTFTAMLAGSVTANPMLFAIAVLLVMAWKTAGWIGLDRWTLPLLSSTRRAGPVQPPDGAIETTG